MCQKWSGMSEISRANQLVHEYTYSANHFLVFLFFLLRCTNRLCGLTFYFVGMVEPSVQQFCGNVTPT